MIVGTAYGLVIAAVLFVVFTYGSPPRELKTISFELSYTFGLASVGGLLSLVVFWQLTGGFPAEHRYFWPGTVTIIILTVGAGYVLSPGRASLDRS